MAAGKTKRTRSPARSKTPVRPKAPARGKGVVRALRRVPSLPDTPVGVAEEVPPPDEALAHPMEECLILSGALVIHEAQEQAARIREALAAGVHCFDLSALRAIDTAGVQLLVALARERDGCATGLALLGCPAHVKEAVRSLGLGEALESLYREAA